MKTNKETNKEIKTKQLEELYREANSLEEFIYDDYGDTVDQLGMEETAKLEQRFKQLQDEINEIVNDLA